MRCPRFKRQLPGVALLAEGVDRNLLKKSLRKKWLVALLAEGVDRNCSAAMRILH